MKHYSVPLTVAVFLLITVAALSMLSGAAQLRPAEVLDALLNGGEYDFTVNYHRLPRTLLSVLVGAGLALSGTLVQGVIRNPLASPDLMGVSAGAGFCATLLMVVYPHAPLWTLPASAVFGGLAAFGGILMAARFSRPGPARLALTGIAVSAFLASGIDYLLITHPVEINTAMVWLTGSLWGRNRDQLPVIFAALACALPLAFYLAWRLDILNLGDQTAFSLGVPPSRVRIPALLLAVVLASISVSVAGTISFIGLLAPHIARLLTGTRHRRQILLSALTGAVMLLISDALSRELFAPVELPAGVITSVIGAPYFIYLLSRYRGW